ncbi:MAG: DMT family transporter [Synergistaceae bacterium]|jgi:drug/metabolite transporter (DMT)-like permease|nr:DMT family transporter [Synergistaceae bacterium]
MDDGNVLKRRIVYVKLLAVSVIWGGTFVAGRYLGGNVTPLVSAGLRFILASVALMFYLAVTRTPIPNPGKKQWLQLAMLGFFGVFMYNICFFYGLAYTTASRASLVVALNPATIALASFCLFHEKMRLKQIIGVLFCISGACLVIISRDKGALAGSLRGDIIILGCVVCWTIYSVFSRSLSRSIGPLLTVSHSIWLGTAMLCAANVYIDRKGFLASLPNISASQWMSLLYLGIIGSALAYIWYYDAIEQIGATRSGAFIALDPVTAVLFGVLLFGETLTLPACVGGVLAVLGIYLCNSA